MAEIVTQEFVKQALRIAEYDGDGGMLPHEDDSLLSAYIETATEAVLRYLKDAADATWTADTAPKAVTQSILIAVQALYDPDKVDLLTGLGTSDPKNPIVAMLCMMRQPTVA